MNKDKDKVKEVTFKIRDGIKNVFAGQIAATALSAAGLGIGLSGYILMNSAMMYAGIGLLVLAAGAAYYSAKTVNEGTEKALKTYNEMINPKIEEAA